MAVRYVIVLPDGAADEPLAELDGRTPLEAARIPNMDWVARNGRLGRVRTVPDVSSLMFAFNSQVSSAAIATSRIRISSAQRMRFVPSTNAAIPQAFLRPKTRAAP